MKTWNKNIRFQHVSTAWAILGPSSITWSTIPVSCTHLLACPVAMSLVRLQPVAAHKFGDSFEPCKLMRQTVSKFVSRFRYRWHRYHRNAKAQRKHMIYGNMKTEVDWSWLKFWGHASYHGSRISANAGIPLLDSDLGIPAEATLMWSAWPRSLGSSLWFQRNSAG